MKHINRYLSLYDYDLTLLKMLNEANYYPSLSYIKAGTHKATDTLEAMITKKLMIENYVDYVEKAKDVIGEEAYEIVMRDYFDKEHWYASRFSVSTYYRKRKDAEMCFTRYMDKFGETIKSVEFSL